MSFEDTSDVYSTIGTELMQLESESEYIAVYAKRDLINELFINMISDGYEFGYADFDMMDEMLKDRVYLMLIHQNCVVSIEPAYSDKNTIMEHDAKTAIISMDDCKQDIIDYCVNSDKNVVLFDFDVDDESEFTECNRSFNNSISLKSDGKHFFVNDKEVDRKTYNNVIAQEFNDVFGRNILDYCEFMDEINEWRKPLRW